MPGTLSERKVLPLLAAVQFINILDFVMVMPLGPFFARDLAFPQDRLGLVAGAYTLAAAVAGLLGSRFLDRFDRRAALAVALVGLVVGTALGGFATSLPTLVAARVVAGLFGGPASSLSMSIVADVVPAERRGKALGTLMGAFSVAQVLGVPIGLQLARLGSWRTPFLAVAALGVPVIALFYVVLPPLTAHLARPAIPAGTPATPLHRQPTVAASWLMTAVLMMGNFALIPYISPFLLNNRHYPAESLGLLYLVGGAVNFVAMRVAGRLTDRFGELRLSIVGTALFVVVVGLGFYSELQLPVMAIFVGLMLSMAFRAVPIVTLTSKVPRPHERARFLSGQSAVQHLSSSLGALGAAQLVHAPSADAPLAGLDRVAVFTIVLALIVPGLLARLGVKLRRRDETADPSQAPSRSQAGGSQGAA